MDSMRDSRLLFALLLVTSLSVGLAAGQRSASPAPKPAGRAQKPAAAAARTTDPFIGVWRLSAEKSKYESGGPPKSFIRTYEDRGGGTIFMTIDAASAQGATTRAYLVYKRDGRPYPEAATGAESIRLVTVRLSNPRTEEITFIVDGKTLESGNTIAISADGMTMTQTVSGKNAQGRTFTNTVVFDKQQ